MRCEADVLGSCLRPWAGQQVVSLGARQAGPIDVHLPGHFGCLELGPTGRIGGILEASVRAWPFQSGSLDTLVLRHLGFVPLTVDAWVNEACRCLAPSGRLLVLAVHPLAAWHLWWRCQPGVGLHGAWLHGPHHHARLLQEHGFHIERQMRYGSVLPRMRQTAAPGRLMAGCFLIQARKQGFAAPRLQLRSSRLARGTLSAPLIPGSRRQQHGHDS